MFFILKVLILNMPCEMLCARCSLQMPKSPESLGDLASFLSKQPESKPSIDKGGQFFPSGVSQQVQDVLFRHNNNHNNNEPPSWDGNFAKVSKKK